MVLGYLFYSGIGWRFGGLFHLLREREKVGLYSYWKICTKNLLNTGAFSGPHHGVTWNKTSLMDFMLQSRKRVLHPVSHYSMSALSSTCERTVINPKHQRSKASNNMPTKASRFSANDDDLRASPT
jgi:hypothetical protein